MIWGWENTKREAEVLGLGNNLIDRLFIVVIVFFYNILYIKKFKIKRVL